MFDYLVSSPLLQEVGGTDMPLRLSVPPGVERPSPGHRHGTLSTEVLEKWGWPAST